MNADTGRHQGSLASRLDVLQVDARLAGKSRDGDTLAEAATRLAKLERELAGVKTYCGRVAKAIGQIKDLANINDETRRMLIQLGNGLNDTSRF